MWVWVPPCRCGVGTAAGKLDYAYLTPLLLGAGLRRRVEHYSGKTQSKMLWGREGLGGGGTRSWSFQNPVTPDVAHRGIGNKGWGSTDPRRGWDRWGLQAEGSI